MIYVILGMHKSGTTLVSQILHHSGINMGDDIDTTVSYDRGNKYERKSTLSLDLDILGLKDNRIIDYGAPGALYMNDAQRARMREIIKNCNQTYDDWGFKDPRASLVYPLWASELPEHKVIAVYRSPSEIWPRFRHRRLTHRYRNLVRAWQLMKRWCEHNSNILSYLRNTDMEFMVINYRDLMSDDAEFERLQEFVGIKLTDWRNKKLYRGRSEEYPLVRFGSWLVRKQTGCNVADVIEQFEALRQTQ